MKKLLLLALIAVMAVGVNAQIVVSQSNIITKTKVEKPKTKKKTTWYMRVGVQASKVAYDSDFLESDDESIKSTAGYNLDFGFQRPMGGKGAYWGMTFGLGSRGTKYKESYEGRYEGYKYEYEYTEKITAHNIQYSPFTFGWKIKLADKLYLDPHIGLYFSVDYTGKIKCKQEVTFGGETEKDEESFSIYGSVYWDDDNDLWWCPADIGLNTGIGIWYDRFNFDITWQRGFVNAIAGDTYDGHKSKANNVMFRLGLAF